MCKGANAGDENPETIFARDQDQPELKLRRENVFFREDIIMSLILESHDGSVDADMTKE